MPGLRQGSNVWIKRIPITTDPENEVSNFEDYLNSSLGISKAYGDSPQSAGAIQIDDRKNQYSEYLSELIDAKNSGQRTFPVVVITLE